MSDFDGGFAVGQLYRLGLAYRMGGTYESDAWTGTEVRLVRQSATGGDWYCSRQLDGDGDAFDIVLSESRLRGSARLDRRPS